MDSGGFIEFDVGAVTLRALSWEPRGGSAEAPVALCLHGFPDTAYGWRQVAPTLADAGWRVIAPFLRGYAPSTVPFDGSFHLGALIGDALRILGATGSSGRDVVIGQDWGGMVANGLAAMPETPVAKAVVIAMAPLSMLKPQRGIGLRHSLPAVLGAQAKRSWYNPYFQLPMLPERSMPWMVPLLWRRWSPSYDATEDLRHVQAAIGAPENWCAALGYYRTLARPGRTPNPHPALQPYWRKPARRPTLYLYGSDDGCVTAEYAPRVERVLGPGGRVRVVGGRATSCSWSSPRSSPSMFSTSSAHPLPSAAPPTTRRPSPLTLGGTVDCTVVVFAVVDARPSSMSSGAGDD